MNIIIVSPSNYPDTPVYDEFIFHLTSCDVIYLYDETFSYSFDYESIFDIVT